MPSLKISHSCEQCIPFNETPCCYMAKLCNGHQSLHTLSMSLSVAYSAFSTKLPVAQSSFFLALCVPPFVFNQRHFSTLFGLLLLGLALQISSSLLSLAFKRFFFLKNKKKNLIFLVLLPFF